MKRILRRLIDFTNTAWAAPILLGCVAILAYGLLLPQLGFYWDELPMTWIRYGLGPEAMTRYFSTNRPVWGLLYQLTTRLLPQIPLDWQIFGLFWRWVSAVLLWAIVRVLWPENRRLALIASLFFLLYPGFNQEWASFLYSHFFIVLCFFLFSILAMLWSFQQPRFRVGWTIVALIFSALNLWMMEYFFVLELFRPFLIFYFIQRFEPPRLIGQKIRRTVLLWIPYLIIFLADVYWRLFIFNNQIYQPTLLPKLKAAPLITLLDLLRTVVVDLVMVSIQAWEQVFHFPNPIQDGPRTTLYYVFVFLAAAVLAVLFLYNRRKDPDDRTRSGYWLAGLGLIAMLAAGGPFWLTGLEVSLSFPANRFTLPFMLGVALMLAGLIELVPTRLRLWTAALLIVLAAGRQALWADEFRRDWTTQKTLFWQLAWRAPGIAPNTLLLLNDGAFQYYADNSLSGALNWIYDPHSTHSNGMTYVLFYPTSRLGGTLPGFQAGQPITYDFISEVFHGNTSQVIAMVYRPPGCLRVLDPLIDSDNHFIPDSSLMRQAATLSSDAWILPDAAIQMPEVYGPEPAHGWCYYFEQADLARQQEDWQRVAQLGDTAFNLNDHPNDPTERLVFIEGYAHVGNWPRAVELAIAAYKISPNYMGPMLCKLLTRMDSQIPASNVKESSLNDLRTRLSCLP